MVKDQTWTSLKNNTILALHNVLSPMVTIP
jgi:hypothetical protein